MIKFHEPESRAEYDQMMAEVVAGADGTGERAALMATKVDDAIQAHRQWAMELEQAARLDGYAEETKRYLKRTRVVINVGEGEKARKVSKARVIGAKRETATGKWVDVQLPFELLTWDDLTAKQVECQQQRQSYSDTLALLGRMFSLKAKMPDSHGPAEAAELLGIDLDDYLVEAS